MPFVYLPAALITGLSAMPEGSCTSQGVLLPCPVDLVRSTEFRKSLNNQYRKNPPTACTDTTIWGITELIISLPVLVVSFLVIPSICSYQFRSLVFFPAIAFYISPLGPCTPINCMPCSSSHFFVVGVLTVLHFSIHACIHVPLFLIVAIIYFRAVHPFRARSARVLSCRSFPFLSVPGRSFNPFSSVPTTPLLSVRHVRRFPHSRLSPRSFILIHRLPFHPFPILPLTFI
jgi:hypothetical protein